MIKRTATYAALALLLCGCATHTGMALRDASDRITENSRPVLLMTATLRNTYKTDFQPRLLVVHVERPRAGGSPERLDFVMDDKARGETDSAAGNRYLLRLPVAAGASEIAGLTGTAHRYPVTGFYFVPLYAELKVAGPGVYYLGHVDATVRPRRGNEFPAGAPIPAPDQDIAGASGGTFDIEISDRFAADEAEFRERFPQLAGVTIHKAILPPFDRAKAQARWEAH